MTYPIFYVFLLIVLKEKFEIMPLMKNLCVLCENKIKSLRVFYQTEDDIQQFLINHNILPNTMFCLGYHRECYFDQARCAFCFQKTRMVQFGHQVIKKLQFSIKT